MKLQKIASLVLAILMVFSLGITAFAEGETGSITITSASSDATYSIYRMLDLESYDRTSGAYSYKVNSAWAGFFATDAAKAYITFDEAGYATWVEEDDEDTKAAFAKLALTYAEDNGIDPVAVSTDTEAFVGGKFINLPLGYYLVDTNVGALCGLTTTNPNASVNPKNGRPTSEKQVLEDGDNQWTTANTADIGQDVEFRVTVQVQAGAQNFVLHDDMAEGLTFKSVTSIQHISPDNPEHTDETVDESAYSVVTEGLEEGCTFEVRFTEEFCEHLEANDKIIVHYTAMLNRNAVIDGEGNPNTAWLTYGENEEGEEPFATAKTTTITKTFAFDIVKTNDQNDLIDGAEFRVYDAPEGGNEVAVVLMDDGLSYRRARADEEGVNIVVTDGLMKVEGFDNGTYYLEEKVAPDGYNKLTGRTKFIISEGNLEAIFTTDEETGEKIYSTGSGVHVVNKTGSMLPETGGMGTTLFYVVGGLLVGGAVVALVSKKRMSAK